MSRSAIQAAEDALDTDTSEGDKDYVYVCDCGREYPANEHDEWLMEKRDHKGVCEDCRRTISYSNGRLVTASDTESDDGLPRHVRWLIAGAGLGFILGMGAMEALS